MYSSEMTLEGLSINGSTGSEMAHYYLKGVVKSELVEEFSRVESELGFFVIEKALEALEVTNAEGI